MKQTQILATPELLELMLDDMGFEDEHIREATREFCLDKVRAGIELNYLQVCASCFAQGYEEYLSRKGEPRKH